MAKKIREIKLVTGLNTISVSELPQGFYTLVFSDGHKINFIKGENSN